MYDVPLITSFIQGHNTMSSNVKRVNYTPRVTHTSDLTFGASVISWRVYYLPHYRLNSLLIAIIFEFNLPLSGDRFFLSSTEFRVHPVRWLVLWS